MYVKRNSKLLWTKKEQKNTKESAFFHSNILLWQWNVGRCLYQCRPADDLCLTAKKWSDCTKLVKNKMVRSCCWLDFFLFCVVLVGCDLGRGHADVYVMCCWPACDSRRTVSLMTDMWRTSVSWLSLPGRYDTDKRQNTVMLLRCCSVVFIHGFILWVFYFLHFW